MAAAAGSGIDLGADTLAGKSAEREIGRRPFETAGSNRRIGLRHDLWRRVAGGVYIKQLCQPIRGFPEAIVLHVAPRSAPAQEVFAKAFLLEGFGEDRKSVVELLRSGTALTRRNFGPPVEDTDCGAAASLLN